MQRADRPRLRLLRVMYPQQFQTGVMKAEAPICRALSGVRVGRALSEAEFDQAPRFRGASSGADKEMVEFTGHKLCRLQVRRCKMDNYEFCSAPVSPHRIF